MTPWQVRVWDWNANEALRYLRPDDVTIRQELGKPDRITLTAPSLGPRSSSGLLTVGRRLIIVQRGGAILSGGLLWSVDDDGERLRMEARGLTELLGRRLLRSSASMVWDANKARPKWVNVDQFRIVADVLANAQFGTGGDLGLVVTGGLSGVQRSVEVDRNAGTDALSFINELAERNNGFDWREVWTWNAGAPERVMRLANKIGNKLDSIRLEIGRNVHGYRLSDTVDNMANAALGLGKDNRRVYVTALAGYPRMETVIRRPRQRNATILTERVQAAVERQNQPTRTLTIELGDRPHPGSYHPGDELFVIVKATKVDRAGGYADLAEWRRITGVTISYADGIEAGDVDTEVAEL